MHLRVFRNNIEITFPYSSSIVSDIKESFASFSIKWEPKKKHWYFPLKTINNEAKVKILESFISRYNATVTNWHKVEEASKKINRKYELIAKAKDFAQSFVNEFKDVNGNPLFEHQKEAVNYLVKQNAILGDSVGLGKTTSSIIAAICWKNILPTLRIALLVRPSLHDNWRSELDRLGIDRKDIEIYSTAKIPDQIDGDYVIIADECHDFAYHDSSRTRKFLNLAESALMVWELSGTYSKTGRPINLYPLLKAIKCPIAENRNKYEQRYCDLKFNSYLGFWDNTGSSNLEELHHKIKDYILARKSNEVLNLPPIMPTKYVKVELSKEDEEEYNAEFKALQDDYYHRLSIGEIKSGSEAMVFFGYLRKISSKYKIPQTIEIVKDLVESGNNVIVFTEYVDSAKEIAKAFNVIPYIGEEKKNTKEILNEFIQNQQVFVGLGKMAGTGLNGLTKANYCILHDRPWNPTDIEQYVGRAHRPNQKNSVFPIWVECGHADVRIDQILSRKDDDIHVIINGRKRKAKNLSDVAEDLLQDIFKDAAKNTK